MTELEDLLSQFERVKYQEDLLTAKRRELAAQIVAAFKHHGDSSKTYRDLPGWKVTIRVPVNSRMDWEKWNEIEPDFITDAGDFRPVEMKPAVSEYAVKWMRENRPALYTRLAEALTVTPGAPQVKVERIEETA